MSSKCQVESFYPPLNVGRVQSKQLQGISPTSLSHSLCWYHQVLWSLFVVFMQPNKLGYLWHRKIVVLYNAIFKQENCFGGTIKGCSDSIPNPSGIPFHTSHSFFFPPMFSDFLLRVSALVTCTEDTKEDVDKLSNTGIWFFLNCYKYYISYCGFICKIPVWWIDALKYFSITTFCGKFSPLKYMRRLNLLMLYIEDCIIYVCSTQPMQSTFVPFHLDFQYMYICG